MIGRVRIKLGVNEKGDFTEFLLLSSPIMHNITEEKYEFHPPFIMTIFFCQLSFRSILRYEHSFPDTFYDQNFICVASIWASEKLLYIKLIVSCPFIFVTRISFYFSCDSEHFVMYVGFGACMPVVCMWLFFIVYLVVFRFAWHGEAL